MQVFPAPHNAGELDETLTNEPCFLEYATCCFCPSPPTARASLPAHSYRYRNWRERPDANAQTSDSGVGTPPPSLVCLCPMVPLSCSRLCSVHSRASLRCFGCAVGFCAVGSDRSACFPSTANDWDLDKIHAARPARPRAVRQRDRPAHSNGTFTQGSSYLHTNATGSILERAAVKGWQKQG